MTKVAIKIEKITSFGGIFHVMEQFSHTLSPVIDEMLGRRCWMSTLFCPNNKLTQDSDLASCHTQFTIVTHELKTIIWNVREVRQTPIWS